jgi:hypothetical protein
MNLLVQTALEASQRRSNDIEPYSVSKPPPSMGS